MAEGLVMPKRNINIALRFSNSRSMNKGNVFQYIDFQLGKTIQEQKILATYSSLYNKPLANSPIYQLSQEKITLQLCAYDTRIMRIGGMFLEIGMQSSVSYNILNILQYLSPFFWCAPKMIVCLYQTCVCLPSCILYI